MKTIKDWQGNDCNLSDEIYEILTDDCPSNNRGYGKGDLVRLISGVDGRKTPGYHFSAGHKTVCSIFTKQAQFIGIPNNHLRKVA